MIDEADKVVGNLMEQAVQQGFYGIMILSPRCPGCGQLHDWTMMSSVGGREEGDPASMDQAALGVLQDQIEAIESGMGAVIRRSLLSN